MSYEKHSAVDVKNADVILRKPAPGERGFNEKIMLAIAGSIEANGLISPPVLRPHPQFKGKYEQVCGLHRILAMRHIKRETFPAFIVGENVTEDDVRMITLAENAFRNPISKEQFYSHVAEWKRLHEAQNPRGAAGGKGKAAAKKAAEETLPEAEETLPEAEETLPEAEETLPEAGSGVKLETKADASVVSANGKARTKTREKVEAEPEKKVSATSLTDLVAGVIGGGKRTATRVIKIAGMIDGMSADEKRIIFPEDAAKHPSKAELLAIAEVAPEVRAGILKLAGAGMAWGEAIKEATKRIAKADPDKPKTADDLSEDEWLDTFCPKLIASLKNKKAFKADALFYRKYIKAKKKLQKEIEGLLYQAKQQAVGPAQVIVTKAFRLRHPNEWQKCATCDGTGINVAEKKHCPSCFGAGYKITSEPI